jgi:hypothetical protein
MKTSKGNDLTLINLKGKSYLQVAYRLLWLNDDTLKFNIETQFLELGKEHAVAKATVTVFDEGGQMVKRAQATKSETIKGFADFIEKAETGAVGRALAMLGFGTQFAIDDLDEGERIVDAPLERRAVAKKSIKKASGEMF